MRAPERRHGAAHQRQGVARRHGQGHSPEHACLCCPALKLFISGDQVLPRLSSNVSVIPAAPNANPVADWLASLAKFRREVPDEVLVLPAYND
ncbi:hypothetical protein QTI66_39035 [Variovorax sp. J22R133]|nr:hypothetical protein [Variovorax sp. J22R133]MDM0118070.1 hypothetical protein [Variovorax sp. J22R133]